MSPMSRAKKRGQLGGHAFSFAYVPPTAYVIWATHSGEVTPWDWTRCDSMKGFREPWKTKSGGLPLYVSRHAPNQFADAHALPVPAMDYPRLVRKGTELPTSHDIPEVHTEFMRLWRVIEKHGMDFGAVQGAFQDAVIKVALRVGILSPHGIADSLLDWWAAALEVAVWADLLSALTEVGNGPLPAEFWPSCEVCWGAQDYTVQELRELAKNDDWLKGMLAQGYTAFRFDTSREDSGKASKAAALLATARSGAVRRAGNEGRNHDQVNATDVRASVAQDCLYAPFVRQALPHSQLTMGQGIGVPTILRVEVGALEWARLELAQIYGATTTKACGSLTCSVVFTPSRNDERFCSKRCKEREKKARQRASQSLSRFVTTASQPPREAE